jgi:translation initiation factor IF-1
LRSRRGYASFRAPRFFPIFSGFSVFDERRYFMSKGDLLEMEGVIQDALGGGQYTIKVDQGGAMVRAQLSGRMRRHHIRVLPGDRVRVAVSPYDLSHGLIVYRGK